MIFIRYNNYSIEIKGSVENLNLISSAELEEGINSDVLHWRGNS